jgi:hypothetical protein
MKKVFKSFTKFEFQGVHRFCLQNYNQKYFVLYAFPLPRTILAPF